MALDRDKIYAAQLCHYLFKDSIEYCPRHHFRLFIAPK